MFGGIKNYTYLCSVFERDTRSFTCLTFKRKDAYEEGHFGRRVGVTTCDKSIQESMGQKPIRA